MHAGIIMDGNGRWARQRGRPRVSGHRAGAAALRRIVEAAPGFGIGMLTLYAFSADNWKRPPAEVSALMELFGRFLRDEAATAVERGVRLEIIGRRDRLPAGLAEAVAHAEQLTAAGTVLRLRVAIDYSGRDAIRRAAMLLARRGASDVGLDDFGLAVAEVDHAAGPVPPLDLLIRTGGDVRLSDFLLWESAYAELFFRPEGWPDFTPQALGEVLAEFRLRERRFGALPATARHAGVTGPRMGVTATPAPVIGPRGPGPGHPRGDRRHRFRRSA